LKPELPRWRLTEPMYLKPERAAGASLFEAGAEGAFTDTPAFGMTPLNALAIAEKVASIRAYGLSRLRQPAPGDRRVLQSLAKSLGIPPGSVDETVNRIETWISQQEAET
jgi:hypothetical protein